MTNVGSEPSLDELYDILRIWSVAQKYRTYSELSRAYQQATGDWFDPHGSWDAPLGQLNVRLSSIGAPALSALVVLKDSGEPGGNFWASAPNVPTRPARDIDRVAEWSRIVKDVFCYSWPARLP